ncbi:single-stranded DNA-binding protein [Veillonellaceae bacterium WCA-693-APC-5D-A]|uniref:Single-stranded DNA-binding protein n=1 Tax=Anaerovibrio slackiae TaxID=2652309 RepID=A0A6I2UDA5_9FIRM|nr:MULTISPECIES: ERF family protein [Anaerovibrio]MCF2601687.1 ERF family protein [Anaerovibrio lipolyticus]MSU07670.1 single-stranded DNA-binding protein [Anaerovibrio slackiae]
METATIQERSIKKISGKLVKVMEDVSHIAKNGTNEFHKYQYATAADVLEKVNDSLCRNKICSLARAELVSLEHVVNARGNQEHLATVRMVIRLIDTESGEWVEIIGLGNGQDGGDKAVMKAETASIKYAYMMAFNISTGDDPEADSRTDQFTAAPAQVYPMSGARQAGSAGRNNLPVEDEAKSPSSRKGTAYACFDCGMRISEKVKSFSESRFGKPLCMDCQKNYASA